MKRGKLTLVLMAAALFLGQISFADVGQVLPKFSFKDAEGKTVTQENLKGKKTLLVFSQMACRQCRYEVKELMSKKDQIANMYVIL
ncbi:redoxin domain-containing protein, partial [bacterium]